MGDICKFKSFIVEAKKNTYASGAKKEPSSRPNSKDYAYKKYSYYYLDSHIGDKEFIGEELVWHNEKVCWGMNYKGQVLVNETPSGFNKFFMAEVLNKNFQIKMKLYKKLTCRASFIIYLIISSCPITRL